MLSRLVSRNFLYEEGDCKSEINRQAEYNREEKCGEEEEEKLNEEFEAQASVFCKCWRAKLCNRWNILENSKFVFTAVSFAMSSQEI